MADVERINIDADIFRNGKIKLLEAMPAGDSIIVIWLKLLCLAKEMQHSDGLVDFRCDDCASIESLLAREFNRPLTTVKFALKRFEEFGMIKRYGEAIRIVNWNKYQEGREN